MKSHFWSALISALLTRREQSIMCSGGGLLMDVVQPKGRSELQERVRVSAIDLDNGRAKMIVMLCPSYAWEPSKRSW
jgi:hypothetical protein